MLTPVIDDHWTDGNRIHVIGHFGGVNTQTYLQNENTKTSGTKVSWGTQVKSPSPPEVMMNTALAANQGSFKFYRVAGAAGEIAASYVKLYGTNGSELANSTTLENNMIQFYAIFHKYIGASR